MEISCSSLNCCCFEHSHFAIESGRTEQRARKGLIKRSTGKVLARLDPETWKVLKEGMGVQATHLRKEM